MNRSKTLEKVETLQQQKTIRESLDISDRMKQTFCKKNIKEFLFSINEIHGSQGYFFMIDFFSNEIILTKKPSNIEPINLASDTSETLIEFIGDAYSSEEKSWCFRMIMASFEVFYQVDEKNRKNLILMFDMISEKTIGEKMTYRHKIIPYQLDKGGKLWLGLGFVDWSSYFLPSLAKAFIKDTVSGKQYIFSEEKFDLTTSLALTQEEVKILRWIANDLTSEQICDKLEISESSFKRIKKKIQKKLNVQSTSSAIYKATAMEFI